MMMMMSLSLCPLSSVFFYFDVSPHLSPLNCLEKSKTVHGGLCTVCMMVLKEVKTVHGGLLSTVYASDGLESSQFCLYTHDGLEMSQFTMLVPNGLERSHLWVVIFSWALVLACHCSL